MKTEPELIDIYAMFAMVAVINKHPKAHETTVAEAAFEYAARMMEERRKYVDDQESV